MKSTCERKVKNLTDKIIDDLTNLGTDLVAVKDRGYPEAMVTFLEEKIATMKEKAFQTHKVYVEQVTKQEIKDPGLIQELHDSTSLLDSSHKMLSQEYDSFKKTTGLDIKRLSISQP